MKNLLIIDGNSIINRAFYGIRLLTNKHGLFTNAIYGFLKIMFKNIEDLKPDYICVAFDLKAPTFRHKMYSGYKAQRKGMPDELKVQMPVMKEVLSAMNIAILEKEGFEADDIIGTVSRMCDDEGIRCHILTGDRDDLQLASQNTDVLLTITRMGSTTTTVYNADAVLKEYGVTPSEFVDVKALMGDSSDNVPGVKGIGEKTAFGYIQKFKSIEALYENLDDSIIKPAALKKLQEGKEMAELSKKLCTIDRFVPIESQIADFERKEYNTTRLTELFINLEFNAFLKDIATTNTEDEQQMPEFEAIDSSALSALMKNVSKELVYQIYVDDSALGFAFEADEKVCYFCADTPDARTKLASAIKDVFENENILKISSDVKSHITLLRKYGIEFTESYFDVSIGAYIINPSKSDYSVAAVSVDLLSTPLPSKKDVFGSGKDTKTLLTLSADTLKSYISGEIVAIEKLRAFEEEKIKADGQEKLFYDIELPLVSVLAEMEIVGFKIDAEALRNFTDSLTEKIAELEGEIYSLAGEEFNINSTKQLGVVLFEKLGLKIIKKTKTGYSTDAAVLEKLLGSHSIIEKIIEYRRAAKLKSTYGDGLLAVINPETGRIHSSFNQTVTTTGRISSTEPNLQNIPMRREEGREIRKMFVAGSEDYILTDADYSQIELRILAHMSGDEAMIEAFRNGEDIHASTASRVFGVEKEDVTPLLRSRAKAVNFGIVYGMGEYSLSQDLHISVKEAKAYIESYFEKYASVKKYLDTTVQSAKENGYVTTMFGRRRYIPEISSSNFMTRSFGERVAMNTPIQGSAADIIKIAMVSVYRELKARKLKSRLILQVHDELIIETARDEAEEVAKLIQDCMMGAADLRTTLLAETGYGENWYDAH
ncbi:MAG: DNA polymerase I [Ruminococcaceae bacterium]|nr:DNA polymerase I [Oscillospiraceae bacterium]